MMKTVSLKISKLKGSLDRLSIGRYSEVYGLVLLLLIGLGFAAADAQTGANVWNSLTLGGGTDRPFGNEQNPIGEHNTTRTEPGKFAIEQSKHGVGEAAERVFMQPGDSGADGRDAELNHVQLTASHALIPLASSTDAPPNLISAITWPARNGLTLGFDRPVADSATNLNNIVISGGLTLENAYLDTTCSNLLVTTSRQLPNMSFSLSVSNVANRYSDQVMPATSTNIFSPPLYGPQNNVPASGGWTLLYSLPIADVVNYNSAAPAYSIDHQAWLTNFSRVAYYLELQASNGPLQYIWVAMDAFSSNPKNVGVPCYDTQTVLQETVSNLDVFTSVAGLTTGTNLGNGYINWFPGSVTNPGGLGPGCMQVWLAGKILFAFSGWGAGGTPDLGIGSNVSGGNADWSFLANASNYTLKRLLVYVSTKPPPTPVCADIVVYGGTSGGVLAAVRAARLGKKAVLICEDNHIGGMTSGGLSWTDVGSHGTSYIGGLALEFYQRNGAHYGTNVQFNVEPHVAEQILGQMLADSGVRVFFNQKLAQVTMNSQRIAQITTEDGTVYAGKMFIDTTYEGDLMAAAGVNYIVGREGTNTYGESLAGTQISTNWGLVFDPYMLPGDPSSGLLPFINPVTLKAPGSADDGLQPYNYRMCFTQTAKNLLPITAPANYDASQYELLARYFAAIANHHSSISLNQFITLGPPFIADKVDINNNNGMFSTDMVGASRSWPTSNYAQRALLRQAHEDYMRGFFTFLATSPSVPTNVQSAMQSWGMCQDEFLDTGGWPHDLYVREGRRMISDYVMTQQNCQGGRVAADSVGLASYNIDTHVTWRIAVNGSVQIEQNIGGSTPKPYPISYRSIVPGAGQCENLFCTFAISASHIGFASYRMEPVFMLVSDAAATAASIAIDNNVSGQNVDYNLLALQLFAQGQALGNPPALRSSNAVIVDNADAAGVAIQGTWSSSQAIAGFYGSDYLTDGNTNKGNSAITFTPSLPSNSVYQVALWWTAYANRATNVPVEIVYPAGSTTVVVNEQTNGSQWVPLLTTNFDAGTNARVCIMNNNTTGYVVADAVGFFPHGSSTATVQVIAPVASTVFGGGAPGVFTIIRLGNTNVAMTVSYTLSGTAQNGKDFLMLPTTINLPPGAACTNLNVTPLIDPTNEILTVTLTLLETQNYVVGRLSQATVTLRGNSYPQPARLHDLKYDPRGTVLNFMAAPQAFYMVQRADTLDGPWANLGIVATDSTGAAQWLDSASAGQQAFYRIVSLSGNY